ncbi:MAG TPA: cytochrome b/b6 domain-containing protein [Paracoccaceae bacterium]|nr:cytochrome b/b6 domain-containing protein [Paracoccaceae bacterium]
MTTKTRYDLSQIVLHWLIAILIASNYLLGDTMSDAFKALVRSGGSGALDGGANAHRLIGVSVVVLLIVRVVLRLFKRGPAEAPGPRLLQLGAKAGHLALYVLMFAVPVSGFLAFNGLNRDLGEVHEVLTNLLMLLAFGHALLAFYHHYILKDGLLNRMIPGK